jgi:hypothetical protein
MTRKSELCRLFYRWFWNDGRMAQILLLAYHSGYMLGKKKYGLKSIEILNRGTFTCYYLVPTTEPWLFRFFEAVLLYMRSISWVEPSIWVGGERIEILPTVRVMNRVFSDRRGILKFWSMLTLESEQTAWRQWVELDHGWSKNGSRMVVETQGTKNNFFFFLILFLLFNN